MHAAQTARASTCRASECLVSVESRGRPHSYLNVRAGDSPRRQPRRVRGARMIQLSVAVPSSKAQGKNPNLRAIFSVPAHCLTSRILHLQNQPNATEYRSGSARQDSRLVRRGMRPEKNPCQTKKLLQGRNSQNLQRKRYMVIAKLPIKF